MADIEDYVGQSFGPFQILMHNGSGAEAEVYLCGDYRTNMTYILRLDAHDDAIWEGDPVIPPVNASIERQNAKGLWHFSDMYRVSVESDSQVTRFDTVAAYGITPEYRLVPVASQYRIVGAWDVDHLLNSVSLDHTMTCDLWDLVTTQIATEAYTSVGEPYLITKWRNRWKDIPGHKSIVHSIESFFQGGTIDSATQQRTMGLVTSVEQVAPDVVTSLLLRLYAGVYHRIVSMDNAKATLLCPHFRRNIAQPDLGLFLMIYGNIKSSEMFTFPDPSYYSVLDEFIVQLCEEPLDEYSDDPRIERRTSQPDIERFSLFLQEDAGRKTEFAKLQRS